MARYPVGSAGGGGRPACCRRGPSGGNAALIDSAGTVQNLQNLIPANSGYELGGAVAINDNGQIDAATTITNPHHQRGPCRAAEPQLTIRPAAGDPWLSP